MKLKKFPTSSFNRVAVALIFTFPSFVAMAQVSLRVDVNDLKSKEIEANYTTGQGTKEVIWTTDAREMPRIDKHNDGCSRIPEYMDGAVCYRVCGGSLASEPVAWTYEWRRSGLAHSALWEACDGNGCKGFSEEYYPAPARGCGHFMIWRGLDHQRDLRIKVQLK